MACACGAAAGSPLADSSARPQVLLPAEERGSFTTLQSLATIFLIGGAILALAGLIDIGLFFVGQRFGDSEWEFGTIIQVIDALPVSMMAVLLLAVGVRIKENRKLSRAIALVCALAVLFLLTLLVIFALDVPVAAGALRRAAASSSSDSAAVVTAIKRGITKTFILGTGYLAAFVGLTITMWRGPRTVAAGS